MDDLDEVRAALGYGRVNLWGGSYGTRAATVFLRRHPESVRTVILDGVAPVDMRIPLHFAEDGQRALNLLADACSRDAACAARFPELRDSVERLLARLDRDPPERFDIRNPRTGDWEEIPIRRDLVAGLLRAVLYSPQSAALVPLMVESALDGDFGPLMTFADPAAGPELSVGMFLSVICAEDIPFVTPEEAAAAAEESFLDEAMVMQLEEACAVWPRGELPPGYREPVRSGAPALVLSGELDPVTPPRWGERVAATLTGARHLVVPGAGHGTLSSGCVPRLIEEFLDAADPEVLDPACLEDLARPAFWLSGTGPVAPAGDGDDGHPEDHDDGDHADDGDGHRDDGDAHLDDGDAHLDDGDEHREAPGREDGRDGHRERTP